MNSKLHWTTRWVQFCFSFLSRLFLSKQMQTEERKEDFSHYTLTSSCSMRDEEKENQPSQWMSARMSQLGMVINDLIWFEQVVMHRFLLFYHQNRLSILSQSVDFAIACPLRANRENKKLMLFRTVKVVSFLHSPE